VGTNARTMKTASRTLVKSPPEVWEQLDDHGRMQGLMSALIGHATEVSVYEREEESKLAWKANSDEARIEIEMAEKGWGTNVSVSAENGTEPTKLEGWLDAVLDELATPTKRPFGGMGEATDETPAPEAPEPVEVPEPDPTPEPVEEPEPEEQDTEQPEPVVAAVEEPKADPEPPAPEPKKKKRFGFLGF
jgi:outer membrane biosynthesis protein TonB